MPGLPRLSLRDSSPQKSEISLYSTKRRLSRHRGKAADARLGDGEMELMTSWWRAMSGAATPDLFGSYYLSGDASALMPYAMGLKLPGRNYHALNETGSGHVKMHSSGSAWLDNGFTRFASSSPAQAVGSVGD
jgi:hypothetical protein